MVHNRYQLFYPATVVLRSSIPQILYAKLSLPISPPPTLNLGVWLEGVARLTNITVRGGSSVSTSTNVVQLNLGLNDFIILLGYFMDIGRIVIQYFRLGFCTVLGGMDTCVYYSIMLEARSL